MAETVELEQDLESPLARLTDEQIEQLGKEKGVPGRLAAAIRGVGGEIRR